LGLYMLKDSKLPEAESYFRKAIAANASFGQAYNNLGVVLERKNKRAEAIKVWESGLKVDPNSKEMKENLARVKGL
jgi:protein O-GlcNAc transferase